MIKVTFQVPEEFIDEMKKSPPWYAIVRLTFLFKQSKLSPNIRRQFVVASFITGPPPPPGLTAAPDTIIRLDKYCGDLWGLGPEDAKTQERAEAVMHKLEAACKELGYEMRAGVYEEVHQ